MSLDQFPPGHPDRYVQHSPDDHPVVLGATNIPAEPNQVTCARRWLRDLLGEDHPMVCEAELLSSELITNSILHSDSARTDGRGRPGTISIAVLTAGQVLRVEVTDAGSTVNVPHEINAGADAVNGRGLRLLRGVTNGRCGTWTRGTRRTVWFELGCTPAPERRHR